VKASGIKPAPRTLSVHVLEAEDEFPRQDSDYWLTRTAAERIAAVEFLRQQFFAPYDPARDRIQRILRLVEPPPD
jgi:hypothetical protein